MGLLTKCIINSGYHKGKLAIITNITEDNKYYVTLPYTVKDKLYGYIRVQINKEHLVPFN